MPKDRYRLMKSYMPTVGSRGLDMMFRTCTIQVNLDFESEADMIEKFRIGIALQPIAVALFANSPFCEGVPTGCLSTRGAVWTDVDAARTGNLPFVFEPDMSFARYVDYAMDVPMYFVYRKGQYINALGQSWRDFMEVRCPALPCTAALPGSSSSACACMPCCMSWPSTLVLVLLLVCRRGSCRHCQVSGQQWLTGRTTLPPSSQRYVFQLFHPHCALRCAAMRYTAVQSFSHFPPRPAPPSPALPLLTCRLIPGASQALPGDAWCRRRPLAHDMCSASAVGWADL
jgi:Glutamate-cysteine ligase family 2(GCS2)